MPSENQPAPQSRPPPRILRVERPPAPLLTPGAALFAVLALSALGLIVIIFGGDLPAVTVGLALIAASALIFWLHTRSLKRARAALTRHMAALTGPGGDSEVALIAYQWSQKHGLTAKSISAALAQAIADSATEQARIVCLHRGDVPHVGRLAFEPVIITPAQYVGLKPWAFLVPAAIVGLWLLQQSGLLPLRLKFLAGLTGMAWGWIIASVGLAAVLWAWRAAIRPTYIRLAPGIIQILEFRYGRSKPLIRAYPMDSQTVVTARFQGLSTRAALHTLTLVRQHQHDELPVWRFTNRKEITQQLWQALLSTAPTPPLSDEDLVG